MSTDTGLQVDNLTKHFALRGSILNRRRSVVHAVDEVSFEVPRGTTLALVGESGCGKSTVARCIVGLLRPTSGRVLLNGVDISTAKGLRANRRQVQMISQNPGSALNRRKTIRHALAQPLEVHGLARGSAEKEERVRDLLNKVGLTDDYLDRVPSGMSGGELQRVVVARSLAVEPTVLILDEPTSSLDVSVKAKLINLFLDLQKPLSLTYLLITHEIGLARHAADAIAVMYLGRIVEIGPAEEVMENPRHPYTKLLLASLPVADPTDRKPFAVIEGEVPSAIDPPSGCRFHTRCPIAIDRCKAEVPELRTFGSLRTACHRADETAAEKVVDSIVEGQA
jgi:oligopeptide/dipeptide ABC transporter ATP-binding protein